MMKRALLCLSMMLLLAGVPAFADISFCDVNASYNNCMLHEVLNYNGHSDGKSAQVPLAVDYESDYPYVVVYEAGPALDTNLFDIDDASNWTDILEFTKVLNQWYVQVYSGPFDASLLNSVRANDKWG